MERENIDQQPRPPSRDGTVTTNTDTTSAPSLHRQPLGASAAIQEPPESMLEVHPRHASVHTWKDFFIHIATIVVGLLIAVGLEQSIVYVHKRHQLAEARESLRAERLENRRSMAFQYHEFQRFNKILQDNLADFIYLQQYPGTPSEKLPARINWNGLRGVSYDSAWNAAKQENLTALMRPDELYNYESLYLWFDRIAIAFDRFRTTLNEARYYTTRDFDSSHLTPQQIEKEIELTEATIYEHYYYGLGLYGLSANFPDMPAPSLRELQAIVHESDEAGTGLSPQVMQDLRPFLRNAKDAVDNDAATKDALAH